jgi:rSAM/selenodomain-associated transferase 2
MVDVNNNKLISVIIPTLNEADNIMNTMVSVQSGQAVEVIVVDGGSSDSTRRLAEEGGARVISTSRGRAVQMNTGAAGAQGEIFLFLHGDSQAPVRFDGLIRHALLDPDRAAGAFQLQIAGEGRGLRIIEKMANWRSRWFQLPYGDQGIFIRAELFRKMGGFPELPIMEDFIFIQRLQRQGRIVTLSASVLTSGRRWESLGIWRTTWRNQMMLAGYYGGISLGCLSRWYRRC